MRLLPLDNPEDLIGRVLFRAAPTRHDAPVGQDRKHGRARALDFFGYWPPEIFNRVGEPKGRWNGRAYRFRDFGKPDLPKQTGLLQPRQVMRLPAPAIGAIRAADVNEIDSSPCRDLGGCCQRKTQHRVQRQRSCCVCQRHNSRPFRPPPTEGLPAASLRRSGIFRPATPCANGLRVATPGARPPKGRWGAGATTSRVMPFAIPASSAVSATCGLLE